MSDSSFLNNYLQSTTRPEAHPTNTSTPQSHKNQPFYVTGFKFKSLKHRKLKQSVGKLQI